MGKKIQKKIQVFAKFVLLLLSLVLSLFGHIFCSWALIGKKLHSYKAYQFFYLQKKFQKTIPKIQPVGTCPKSHLSLKLTMVL